jgi:hypothetical protein
MPGGFRYTGSGGFVVAGAATTSVLNLNKYSYAGAGVISVSGTATVHRSVTRNYIGSGGFSTFGVAWASFKDITKRSYAGAGVVSFSGAALVSTKTSTVYTGSGGVAFSGSAVAYGAVATSISASQVKMLTDLWQRLGLDPNNPLTETRSSATVGNITLTKTGSSSIATRRSGGSIVGDPGAMLLDLWRRFGLDPDNPMTVDANSIIAGPLTLTNVNINGGSLITRIPAPYWKEGYGPDDYVEWT